MSEHTAETDVPQPVGRPQGGMKSEMGKAAYWRMQYESAIGALADLIAENTENVDFARAEEADQWKTRIRALADEFDEVVGYRGVATRLRWLVDPPADRTE